MSVYSRDAHAPTLRIVEARAAEEHPVQATMRVSPSLWRRVKIAAIRRGITVGALVEEWFEEALGVEDGKAKGKKS